MSTGISTLSPDSCEASAAATMEMKKVRLAPSRPSVPRGPSVSQPSRYLQLAELWAKKWGKPVHLILAEAKPILDAYGGCRTPHRCRLAAPQQVFQHKRVVCRITRRAHHEQRHGGTEHEQTTQGGTQGNQGGLSGVDTPA